MQFYRMFFFCFLIIVGLFSYEQGYAHPVTHAKKTHKTHRTNSKKHFSHKRSYEHDNSNAGLRIVYQTAKPVYMKAFASNLFRHRDISKQVVQTPELTFDPRESSDNSAVALETPFKQIYWPDIANHLVIKHNRYYVDYMGYTLLLTLDPLLQEASIRYLRQTGVVEGATVLIEPHSGRVLALAQSGGSKNTNFPLTSRAPAASLMKMITASSTIEKENLDPYDDVSFRGGCGNLRHENWMVEPSRDKEKLKFARAFGSSCNTVFARLALYRVGLSSLKIYAEKFMFNKPIPSDLKIQTSLFLLPELFTAIPQEVAEAGAGFGATKLSPIHAALLSATIGNGGVMLAPHIVDAAYDSSGKLVYKAKPIVVNRVVSKETADQVQTLMLATVATGTSRRAFHRLGTRYNIDEIGGKTGTLLDPENRDLLYTWFSGIAPINSPNSVSIGTIVASLQNWVVRASSVAQGTLAEFLRAQKSRNLYGAQINPH